LQSIVRHPVRKALDKPGGVQLFTFAINARDAKE